MSSVRVNQPQGYTAGWAAPEILMGADKITQEADIFAFGMVVIEVCLRMVTMEGQIVHLTSEPRFRLLQEGTRSAASGPHLLI